MFILPVGNGLLNQVLITDGFGDTSWSNAGAGTVSSVGLSMPGIFTVSGSPVTGAGTLTATLNTENANSVWVGPATGAASAPTFRALVGADLPNPAASTLGGIESLAAVTHKWINTISTSGVPTATQPAFTDISGSITSAQCPNPTASTTGCVESLVATAHQWINTISTSGVPSSTQPNFADLAGSATLSQFPSIGNNSIIANNSGGSSVPSTLTTSQVLDMIATVQGDILYRNASSWVALAPGTSGQVLATGGAAANPAWQTVSGTGTVTNVATGTGLTGGPITVTGTLSFASIANHDVLANISGGSAAPIANTMTAILDDTLGSTQGDILYRGSSAWQVLAPGTNGQVLTQGASTPSWASAGTVSSVATGTGLTGGTITTSGTISLAQMAANTVKCNPTGSLANAQDCTSPIVSGQFISNANGAGSAAAFLSSAAFPNYAWQATGQAADQKNWDAIVVGGPQLTFRAVDDANSTASTWMTVTRGAGATVASVSFPAPSLIVPYTGGLFSNGSPAANITRIDRLLVSTATINSGDSPTTTKDWLETLIPNTTSISQMASISPAGAIGVLGASRTSDGTGDALGNTGFVNNNVSTTGFGWAFYGEAWNNTAGGANAAFTTATELDIVNKNATPVVIDPYNINPGGQTAGVWLASGGSRSSVHTASAAMVILNNGADFGAGIIFQSNALASASDPAIALPASDQIVWFTSAGVTGGSITSTGAPGGLSFQVGSALAEAVFFNGVAHIETTSGLAPALTTCGSPGASIVGNDWGGAIVAGTGATACTMTFSHTYAAQPLCTLYQQGGTSAVQETSVSLSAITFVAVPAGTYIYHCFARPGG